MDDELTPRAGHSCTAIPWANGEALLAFGGFDGKNVCNDAHVFIPHAERWSPLNVSGSPPAPRGMHAAALLGNSSLVVHGGVLPAKFLPNSSSLFLWDYADVTPTSRPCTRRMGARFAAGRYLRPRPRVAPLGRASRSVEHRQGSGWEAGTLARSWCSGWRVR